MTVKELRDKIKGKRLKPDDEVWFICSLGSPTVTWVAEDIMEYMPDWTEEQAEKWLNLNRVANTIQGAMIQKGRDIIEEFLFTEFGRALGPPSTGWGAVG